MTVQQKLLDVLVCPACKGPLTQVQADDGTLAALDCPPCRLRYPIVDDIPVMLVDQAQKLPA
jgi:uncharacterized protein YbaR (Trm112 family)